MDKVRLRHFNPEEFTMWICKNNAFVSIVQPKGDAAHLLCRARVEGHLEAVFPGCKVQRTPGRDYLFRTLLPRERVAATVAQHLMAVEYPNFKNSVRDPELHRAYAHVWGDMAALQPIRPYATKPTPKPRATKATPRNLEL